MNFKLSAVILLALASVVLAGPATTNNNIDITKDLKCPAAETLKQWCGASQMSQPELTQAFKKLVGELKQQVTDDLTDAVVINGHLCKTVQNADMGAEDLVKDAYMDALSACNKRECMKQLVKCIDSGKVDKVRANYYMTRLAVNDDNSAFEQKDMIQELSESFVQSQNREQSLVSMAVQRQKMFAVTANLAKQIQKEMERGKTWEQVPAELKQTVERVVRAINDRFVKTVSQQDVEEYKQKSKTPVELSEKIAERNAAMKAIANIPGHFIQHIQEVQQTLIELAKNKQELSTVRQTAIEALEQNNQVEQIMTELALHQQDEPIEVRIAAYRCLMSIVFAGAEDESTKQQKAQEIVTKVLRFVENTQNQQQDQQFTLYVISHLDNLRTSEDPNHVAIKDVIHQNKQHHMQISLLNRKFKDQLAKFGKTSRNYQVGQTLNKIASGLIFEGDVIVDEHQQNGGSFLPKLVRVNVSVPVMGQTVNVVEVSIRQDNMEKEFINALRPLQDAKFTAETIEKVVGEFKQQVNEQEQRQQKSGMQQQTSEADIAIKFDGCTVVYLCKEDLKTQEGVSRKTRSIGSTSALEDILSQLKRNQLSFNRGFHFDFNKRIASILDVEAHLIGGLLLDSSVKTPRGAEDFEVQIQMEPRVSFEAIVGPTTSNKRLLQRASTKTAIAMRLRYKKNELVDVQVDLPLNEMELFKIESQIVEKKAYQMGEQQLYNQYSYAKDSIYGDSSIYAPEEHEFDGKSSFDSRTQKDGSLMRENKRWRVMKRSIFDNQKSGSWSKIMSGKQTLYIENETPEIVARATGLRSKLNIVASPNDLTFVASCIVKKYEPSMQGYRVQVQQQQHNSQQTQYAVLISTPGSRVNRDMRLAVIVQQNQQRTLLKTDLSSQLMNGVAQVELIHDGRQYVARVEAGSQHTGTYKLEAGVQHSSQSGKIAVAYKPYLLIQAPELRRPIQIQGLVSYQQSPKTVIAYELKTQDSAKFIQGKFILQQRNSNNQQSSLKKRSSWDNRRSMQSPWTQMLQGDLTMTNEIVAQWKDLSLKQTVIVESENNVLGFDIVNLYKTKHSHKTEESRMTLRVNYAKDRRSVHLEHRCSTFPVHNFRFDSQYDAQKKQEIAKFVSKSVQGQFVADWQSNKIEFVVDSEGRRIVSVQCRVERQGDQYHCDGIAQYKGQPWAKISTKVPAMLMDEPIECLTNLHRLHKAVIEADAVVYQPQQAQLNAKLDLQKKEMNVLFDKRGGQQQYQNIKARLDDSLATIFVDAIFKSSMNGDAKAQAKINLPGLIKTLTFGKTASSSWTTKKNQWGLLPSSWMTQGQVDVSELDFVSRNTQLKAKLVPQQDFELVIKGNKLQHQSRFDLNPNTPVFKIKSSTVLGRRSCNVDAQIDVEQKMAIIKADNQQSNCQLVFDWPQKKIDLVLDVDGVRVLSHQSSLSRANKFINLNSNSDYYQQPYLNFAARVPSFLVDEPASILDFQRMTTRQQRNNIYQGSELNFGSKLTQMKFKFDANELSAFVKTPTQQHQGHLDLQTYNFNLLSSSQGGLMKNYKFDVDVDYPQQKSIFRYTDERVLLQVTEDWIQKKLDFFAEIDGRRIVSSNNRFERQGEHYILSTQLEYKNQPWIKLSGKIPAMLADKPREFFTDMHSHSTVIEVENTLYQPSLAQISAKCDLAQKDMYIVYKNEREQQYDQINARFEDNTSNLIVDVTHKSGKSGDAKLQAKINMLGLLKTIGCDQTQSSWTGKSQWTRQSSSSLSWDMLKGQVETSEINYQSREAQLKIKLVPSKEMTVVINSKTLKHQSRLDLDQNTPVFDFKSDTQLNNYRHCNALVKIDTDSKMATIKASYRQTEWQAVVDMKAQKLTLDATVNGARVIAHQARVSRQGQYYVLDTQVEYKQQPYARIQAQLPAIVFDVPSSLFDLSTKIGTTQIVYESQDASLKMKLDDNMWYVYFDSQRYQHESRLVEQGPVYKLNTTQVQKKNGREYQIEAELDTQDQKSTFKAFDKPTGQIFADLALSKRALLAF